MDCDSFDALMRLSIEGPSIEMALAAAVDKFATHKARKVEHFIAFVLEHFCATCMTLWFCAITILCYDCDFMFMFM